MSACLSHKLGKKIFCSNIASRKIANFKPEICRQIDGTRKKKYAEVPRLRKTNAVCTHL